MVSAPDPGGGRPAQLPRGRHGLSRTLVVENQRERILTALAAVCTAKGYPAVTVEDICVRAGVSRRTFYDLFADKEQCFLAAYEQIALRLLTTFDEAYRAAERSWPERVGAALRALIKLLAAEPELARVGTVEVLAAGPRALARRDGALRAFSAYFDGGRAALPESMADRELVTEAVVGGLYELLYSYVLEGRGDELSELLPDLLYCAVVPYVGHARAMAAREAERGQASCGAGCPTPDSQ